MLLEDLKKQAIRANELELGEGVGVFIRTLPYISARRFTNVSPEVWEKLRLKTRGEMVEALKIRLLKVGIELECAETLRQEMILIIMYLYPKEYKKAYKLNFSKLDRGRKKLIEEIHRIIYDNRESDKERKEELI